MLALKITTSIAALLAGVASAQSDATPVTGLLGNATITTGNSLAAGYLATLPNSDMTDIRGAVVAASAPSGTGVSFQVSLSGFPSEGGPFLYHIHNDPVSDGNCSTTAHVDPFERGEVPACDADLPMTCQVGDLAGKHGSIPGPSFSAAFIDDYVSTIPSSPSFVGNRSLVVHYANKTIITCANFMMLDAGVDNTTTGSNSTASASSTAMATGMSSTTAPTTNASPAASTGGAPSTLAMNALALFMGALAFLV